jgi:hypothetical protein
MGATLVTQVLAYWTDVSDPAFRILIRMAVTALDAPSNGRPAAVYHAGRELLAMTFRSQKGSERTRNRAVAKAIAELTELGAIEHLLTGWAGQRAVYKLTLDRVERAGMGGPTDHPVGVPTDHPMGGQSATKRVVPQTTPRNHEEPIQELKEEESVDLGTASNAPCVSAEVPKTPESSPRPDKCPTHGLGGGVRPDGLPECTFCRREQRGGPPRPPEPDPPPTGPGRCDHTPLPGKDRCRICAAERVAPVIRLDSRRPA